jgi:hypothetical protein
VLQIRGAEEAVGYVDFTARRPLGVKLIRCCFKAVSCLYSFSPVDCLLSILILNS